MKRRPNDPDSPQFERRDDKRICALSDLAQRHFDLCRTRGNRLSREEKINALQTTGLAMAHPSSLEKLSDKQVCDMVSLALFCQDMGEASFSLSELKQINADLTAQIQVVHSETQAGWPIPVPTSPTKNSICQNIGYLSAQLATLSHQHTDIVGDALSSQKAIPMPETFQL